MDVSVGALTADLRTWQLGELFIRVIFPSGCHPRGLCARTVPLSWEVAEMSLFK